VSCGGTNAGANRVLEKRAAGFNYVCARGLHALNSLSWPKPQRKHWTICLPASYVGGVAGPKAPISAFRVLCRVELELAQENNQEDLCI